VAKERVLAARAAAGEQLYHPLDAPDLEGVPAGALLAKSEGVKRRRRCGRCNRASAEGACEKCRAAMRTAYQKRKGRGV
jgi:hypothetical protein